MDSIIDEMLELLPILYIFSIIELFMLQ